LISNLLHSFPISITKGLRRKKKAKDKLSLSDCINLTGAKSVARTTHDGLLAENKSAASDEINKTLKIKINKEVKSTLLDIAYREKLDLLLRQYLTESVKPAKEMIHPLKLTLEQLVGTHHALKVTCTYSYFNEHVIIAKNIINLRRLAIG
jgi:hypothetical protein